MLQSHGFLISPRLFPHYLLPSSCYLRKRKRPGSSNCCTNWGGARGQRHNHDAVRWRELPVDVDVSDIAPILSNGYLATDGIGPVGAVVGFMALAGKIAVGVDRDLFDS